MYAGQYHKRRKSGLWNSLLEKGTGTSGGVKFSVYQLSEVKATDDDAGNLQPVVS